MKQNLYTELYSSDLRQLCFWLACMLCTKCEYVLLQRRRAYKYALSITKVGQFRITYVFEQVT